MGTEKKAPLGRDLSEGISEEEVKDGVPFGGHLGEEDIILVRRGEAVYAIGALCTHYSGPLVEGLVVDDTIRCPWHHACFDLRTGSAKAPALKPVSRWEVVRRDGKIHLGDKLPEISPAKPSVSPSSIVIVGGGAAAQAAAEILRNEGYNGPLTMVSAASAPPVDRPNLSKDYLAGNAPEEWIPLRGEDYYSEQNITLKLNTRAADLDTEQQTLQLGTGESIEYGALLLATGSEPVRLPLPGGDLPHVFYLRSLDDSRDIIAAIENGAKRAVVIGASFIGLEVAASLRAREVDVHVVAPEDVPMARIMGDTLGNFIKNLHESKGVTFHLGQHVKEISQSGVTLSNGEDVEADLVVLGVGVRPNLDLAEAAGLSLDEGVLVDEYLQTSAPNVYAAGDIARWPDPRSSKPIRVEHWSVAGRQGQAAARNILGAREKYTDVPFFWSRHYNASISYSGHTESWDHIETDGDAEEFDFSARFIKDGETVALATIYRNQESMEFEAELEKRGERSDR